MSLECSNLLYILLYTSNLQRYTIQEKYSLDQLYEIWYPNKIHDSREQPHCVELYNRTELQLSLK